MSVKVIKNKVFDGAKTYEVGDVIEGLSENDKSQLVLAGIVEYVYTSEKRKEISTNIGKEEDLKVDTEIAPSDETKLSEEEEISPESEEDLSDLIDPNSLALNTDDYIKNPASKNKKEKAF
jgi:hypothetical protein